MLSTYKALLIDFDGTLVDNSEAFFKIYADFAQQYGFIATQKEFDELDGKPLKACLANLKHKHSISKDLDQLLNEYIKNVDAMISALPPHSKKLLEFCYDKKIKVAIVTSSPKARIFKWIDQHKLSKHVLTVISCEDVQYGKPNPEPYKKALKFFNIKHTEALAVEDSVNGLHSSTGAAVQTAFLGESNSIQDIEKHKFFSIKSLSELLK